MAAVNILSTLASWARNAWNVITGLPADVANGAMALWHYISNVHNALSWIIGYPQLRWMIKTLGNLSIFHAWQLLQQHANDRIPGWVWLTLVKPYVTALNNRIDALFRWTKRQLHIQWVKMWQLYFASLAYTRQLVGIERNARIKAVAAEHAAMLQAVAACLATVQRQAADGYNSGLRDRLSTAAKLLNDLADRVPAVSGLVKLLVGLVVDLESIDNPLIRFGIGKLVGEIIGKLGIDKVTGDLIQRLLEPFTTGGKAAGLEDVERDVSARLNALEQQWADFMAAGGPEVEQAGSEWKDLTSLAVDAGLVAFFALAVTDPHAWATGVADTVGAAGNDTLDAIFSVIGKV